MTIAKLDEIISKFEGVHHQMPEYICFPPAMYDEIAVPWKGQPDTVLKIRGVPLKLVYFQKAMEVVCCGKRFDERYLVTPGGDIIVSEMRPSTAAAVLTRIAEVYALYLYGVSEVVQMEDITDEERDEVYAECTVAEHNYAQACLLYEMDEDAFIAKYGKYASPDVTELTIQMDVLIHGGRANG